ncbi:hypothetical protein PG993_006322 [Apiospora rasikravindrae]|uniref:Class II aldolase/adducin N-terminal domain-containing protein n=1 Tax=Apiospora rasikravindrae TaxID=990691 RepID=A0ABR1T5D8_9PEZI
MKVPNDPQGWAIIDEDTHITNNSRHGKVPVALFANHGCVTFEEGYTDQYKLVKEDFEAIVSSATRAS